MSAKRPSFTDLLGGDEKLIGGEIPALGSRLKHTVDHTAMEMQVLRDVQLFESIGHQSIEL